MHLDPDITYEKIEARRILHFYTNASNTGKNPSAISDARCMLGIVLGRDRAVLPHELIELWEPHQNRQLDALWKRRQIGEPISRMRGWREFWSMRFDLSSDTLDPRPDSETLIEVATLWGRYYKPSARVLDLGTGSGCLLLACLAELPEADGVGIDISGEAVDTAIANANRHSLSNRVVFYQQDFSANIESLGHFDLIISNPPYIPTADIAILDADVRHFDPLIALDGGPDGLDCWRVLLPQIAALLSDKGMAFVEIGVQQREPVVMLGVANGLRLISSHADLSGQDRCLQFQKEFVT